MAVVTAGDIGINLEGWELRALRVGVYASWTSTKLVVETNFDNDVFFGTFEYGPQHLESGILTGWRNYFGNRLVFEVTGAAAEVGPFMQAVLAGDDLNALSMILAGDDQITGSPGIDNLYAFGGNDSILAGAGGDRIDGGVGNDTVSGGLGNDIVSDAGGSNYLRGDEGDDRITGGAGFDDINGNTGNDTASGGAGEDWVVGGKDNDSLSGDAAYDLVYGNLGSDTCDGGAGNDIVRGGQDDDIVRGGDGNDYVSGDKGSDTITGGAGADIFHTFGDAGVDRVMDFSLAEGDRVQVDPGTTYTVSQVGADAVINMTGGGQMVLVGVQMSSLTGSWIFGA